MEDALKCNVCLGYFNEDTHKPYLLPKCGHSICKSCLGNLLRQTTSRSCPECRKPNAIESENDLPINYNLLHVAKNYFKKNSANMEQDKNTNVSGANFSDTKTPMTESNLTRLSLNSENLSSTRDRRRNLESTSSTPQIDASQSNTVSNAFLGNSSLMRLFGFNFQNSNITPTSSSSSRHTNFSQPSNIPSSTSSRHANCSRASNIPPLSSSLSRQLSNPTSLSSSVHANYSLASDIPPPSSASSRHPNFPQASNVSLSRHSNTSQASNIPPPSSSGHTNYTEFDDFRTAEQLQEEIDFQMALHLTFCKDASHKHDENTPGIQSWSYPDDEDIQLALKNNGS